MLSIILAIIPLFAASQAFSSPVLLWSNGKFPQSAVPLSTLSPLDVISNYICKIDSEQVEVHLFAVDQLRNEDIHRSSQSSHPILIDAKTGKSQYLYIPSVADDVYKTFSLIPQSNNMQCSRIHFQIVSSTIYQTLEEALNAMQSSLNRIETNSKTVTVMALISSPVVGQSLTRQRRAAAANDSDVVVSTDGSCMLYAEMLSRENSASVANYSLDFTASSCERNGSTAGNNSNVAILNLVWNDGPGQSIIMRINASISGLYWYFNSATINDTEYRYFAYGMPSKMDTPPTYSYVCTKALFVKYEPAGHGKYDFLDKVYITNFQFQPFRVNGSHFGRPNYCTSFFTSGIWMGITSSLLCLAILLFGVHRLMSIKSNDRFDDPKGKPLVIKAQE